MRQIDVVTEFHDRLTNRNSSQGDGKHTAKEFRHKFLNALENDEAWNSSEAPRFVFNFSGVKKITPSFANEAFAHFTHFADLKKIQLVFQFENINRIHLAIIEEEIRSGYVQ